MLNICVNNYEVKVVQLHLAWMEGWMDGRMDVKAGLRIAYSNQKSYDKNQWKIFQTKKRSFGYWGTFINDVMHVGGGELSMKL